MRNKIVKVDRVLGPVMDIYPCAGVISEHVIKLIFKEGFILHVFGMAILKRAAPAIKNKAISCKQHNTVHTLLSFLIYS